MHNQFRITNGGYSLQTQDSVLKLDDNPILGLSVFYFYFQNSFNIHDLFHSIFIGDKHSKDSFIDIYRLFYSAFKWNHVVIWCSFLAHSKVSNHTSNIIDFESFQIKHNNTLNIQCNYLSDVHFSMFALMIELYGRCYGA